MLVLWTRQGVRRVSKGKANCPQTCALNCYSIPPRIPYMWLRMSHTAVFLCRLRRRHRHPPYLVSGVLSAAAGG